MPQAFICDAVRTPIGRYGGALSTVRTDDLGAVPLRALLARNPKLDPAAIDDVVLGCANQAGEDNRNVARMSLLLAGLPDAVPGVTVNRLCGSGMDAVAVASRAIAAGEQALVLAGGVESMSRAPLVMNKADGAFSRNMQLYDSTIGWRFINARLQAQYGTESMPETAENLASQYAISRADQDAFALRSQQRTARAQAAGLLAREIVPVEIPRRRGPALLVETDEHPRPDTDAAALAALRPIVRSEGSVTAGNASGVNDGACALLLADESALAEQALTPLARIVGTAVAGVEPRIMGIGPVPAVNKLLARTGLRLDAMDVIEINEAFAVQVLACLRALGLPDDAPQVNALGGAIALGHPLGMSGARLLGSAAYQLHHGGGRYALCAMCIGVGQGIAVVLERA